MRDGVSGPTKAWHFTTGLLVAVVLFGCASNPVEPRGKSVDENPSRPSGPQDLVVATVADIVKLDPLTIGDDPSSLVAEQVMEHLVGQSDQGNFIPALAEKWTPSADGLTWTFELRKGVKFHDNSDFNADVVKWHYDRVLFDKDAPTLFRKQWGDIIKEVKVVDTHKLDFVLRAPNSAFIDLVITTNAGLIWSKANFDQVGPVEAARKPVGTGPFRFKEWVPGQKVILEANKEYWGEKTKLRTLTFRPIPECDTQVQELERGGVHMVTKLDQKNMDRLKSNKEIKVETIPAYKVRYLSMNVSRAPLDNVKVRQAINYTLDITTIVKSLVGDLAFPVDQAILPLASWGYPAAGEMPIIEKDLNKARELLADAGWKPGTDGKLMRDGKPLKFSLYTPNGRYLMDKQIAEAMKNQLNKAGFEVDLQVMEWAPFLATVQSSAYDMAFLGWNQTSPDPSIFFEPIVKTGGRANSAKISDKELDGWLDEGVKAASQTKRKQFYVKVAKRVTEQAWFVPLYNEMKVVAIRKELKGHTLSSADDGFAPVYLEGEGD